MGCRLKYCPLILFMAASLPGATFYVTIAGLGGDPAYDAKFPAMAMEIDKLVRATSGAQVTTLTGPAATKQRLEQALSETAKAAKPEDTLVVTLIGHGNFDGLDYKVNIAGADATAVDIAGWMDKVPAMKQVVINTTSASGASIEALRRENRIVIAATKSATERLATQFGRFWVEALRDPEADTDKNEVISALEAFRYADKKVVNFYETQKRLATEHAVLEDTGRGAGVRAPSPENGEGLLAAQTALLRFGALQQAARTPAKQALLKKREEIEGSIEKLKYEKAAMPAAEYRKQLATLLLELARVQEEIDQ